MKRTLVTQGPNVRTVTRVGKMKQAEGWEWDHRDAGIWQVILSALILVTKIKSLPFHLFVTIKENLTWR